MLDEINASKGLPNPIVNSADLRDDTDWADRCNYWLKKAPEKSRRFSRWGGIRQPLVLSGHGISLRVDHGALLVRNGFTHYPQQREEWRFFSGDWRLPCRIVVIDVDGGLTFGALSWLATHNLPLVHINWRGDVLNVTGSGGGVIDPALVKCQRDAQTNGRGRKIMQQLIQEKIANCIDTLQRSFPKSTWLNTTIAKLEADRQLVEQNPSSNANRLMGVEGRVAYAYFNAWRVRRINWTGVERNPIPDDWYQIGHRASKVGTISHPNRNATHPVNAMLNYGYGILENDVRQRVAAAGLDPRIGFMHGSYSDKLPLVYDLMEPLRPIVDRQILGFVQETVFSPQISR